MLAKNLPTMVESVASDECIYNLVYTAIEQTQSLRSLVCWFDTIFVVQLRDHSSEIRTLFLIKLFGEILKKPCFLEDEKPRKKILLVFILKTIDNFNILQFTAFINTFLGIFNIFTVNV